jgi:hypothetical protein
MVLRQAFDHDSGWTCSSSPENAVRDIGMHLVFQAKERLPLHCLPVRNARRTR